MAKNIYVLRIDDEDCKEIVVQQHESLGDVMDTISQGCEESDMDEFWEEATQWDGTETGVENFLSLQSENGIEFEVYRIEVG